MTNQKKVKVGANISDALNATGNVPRTVDHVGEKRLELKRNVVFKVADYLEEFTAWKSETLKQFYVSYISREFARSRKTRSQCGSHYKSVSAAANASAQQVTRGVGGGGV